MYEFVCRHLYGRRRLDAGEDEVQDATQTEIPLVEAGYRLILFNRFSPNSYSLLI
jgi:hypothetical protein